MYLIKWPVSKKVSKLLPSQCEIRRLRNPERQVSLEDMVTGALRVEGEK